MARCRCRADEHPLWGGRVHVRACQTQWMHNANTEYCTGFEVAGGNLRKTIQFWMHLVHLELVQPTINASHLKQTEKGCRGHPGCGLRGGGTVQYNEVSV